VLGSGAWLWAAPGDAEASQAERCRDIRTASEERRAVVAREPGPRIAVIGDSWSQGTDLADPAGSWPSRLQGTVVVDGFGGSGFTIAASPCRDVAFPLRVDRALATGPDLVVVQGGLNDFDVSDSVVRQGVEQTLRRLEGQQVVVVGPAAAPRRAAGAARVDALLAQATADAGVPYIRTSGWELEYLSDRLHLTPEGHAAFGDAVQAELSALLDD
jgi:acyl-CoA thioesterase-1